MENEDVIAALEEALRRAPESVALRLHLASLLLGAGIPARALVLAQEVLASEPANLDALRLAASAAAAADDPARATAYERLAGALDPTEGEDRKVSTPPLLPAPPEGAPGDAAFAEMIRDVFGEVVPDAPAPVDAPRPEWDIERPTVTLADVAGMADVKRRLGLAFLAPMRNPEVMKSYRMRLGGGLLLYGPPGCGKTFLARATAGELGTRFIGVGLSDILDMYLGESERKLHEVFEMARRNAPCVLFFDEVDALGQRRSNLRTAPGHRAVVNQLLAEMDGATADNAGVFVLAASNHPWDVDTALRRPGRFDRLMLVLPPDEPAREAIVELHLRGRPTEGIDVRWVARQTGEFSGADLAHLCDVATEAALEDSLRSGTMRRVTLDDFRKALKEVRPSTRPWFEVAKNYAMFANEGGTYDQLLEYVRSHRI